MLTLRFFVGIREYNGIDSSNTKDCDLPAELSRKQMPRVVISSEPNMMSKLLKLFLLSILLQALLPVRVVRADTGPKPTMDFEFKPEPAGEPVTIVSGILYECEQSDCRDASPLMEAGPQRFTCEADRCHALAYGFRPYHRLEVQFSDGQTRRSNIFKTAGFDSRYTVTIQQQELLVEAQLSLGIFPRTGTVLVACICALGAAALLAGSIVFLVRRSQRK